MCVLISATFALTIFIAKKNSETSHRTCSQLVMWNTRYSGQILIKLKFPQQILEI
jgi:hypothetical protein